MSFSIGAYVNILLLIHTTNPTYWIMRRTPQAHNVILIDGQGAPDKGLLTDFGDADAWLLNMIEGKFVDYAEAHQSYEGTDFERSMMLVRNRYFVVSDRLKSNQIESRRHSWRLHAGAGADLGGVLDLSCFDDVCGVTIEQENAGVNVYLASTAEGLLVRN